MKLYLCGFVLVATAGDTALADHKFDAERKKLEGTWDLKAVEVKGKQFDKPDVAGGRIIFAKNMKVIIKDPGKPEKRGKYKIDASKSPKHLDLIGTKEGNDGDVIQTIYEVENGELRIGSGPPRGTRLTRHLKAGARQL